MLVSVIIPALNEAECTAQAVRAARQGYGGQEVEILVVDGASTDGTAEAVPPQEGVCVIAGPRGRAVQMNCGARASKGSLLVFCHADSLLPAGWREAVIGTLERSGVIGGTFQTLILPAKGFFALRNHLVFPANWRIMFGDQVQFMRRTTYDRVGGFPDIPLMEDVEMSRALHREGKLVRIHLRVVTSSRRFQERGALQQTVLNAWNMTQYLYLGVTPEDIARTYCSGREVRT